MKKIILFFIAISSVLYTFAYDFETDGIFYNITSDIVPYTIEVTYETSNYNSYSGTISIPESVTYNDITYSVIGIGSYAFFNCDSLTSITFPFSITDIGYSAFTNCYSLTSVTIPASVTVIGNSAFSNCDSLTSITIPASVTSIGDYAFYECNVLISITIPSSVTYIGEKAFHDCTSLVSIAVDKDNMDYSSANGVLFNYDKTTLISYPTGKQGGYIIPSSVIFIESFAFSGCTDLTSVTIPSSVTLIGEFAFDDCDNLISVTIPSSVTSIDNCAFFNCTGLTSITIPSSVIYIGIKAFINCNSLTSVTIPSSVTHIGWNAFKNCTSLTSIYANNTTPESIIMGNDVFYNVNKETCYLYVPIGSITLYEIAEQWQDFNNTVEKNVSPNITTTAPDSAIVGVEYIYTIIVTDVDEDSLTYTLSNAPMGMTITDNIITWTPSSGITTSGKVTVEVSDGNTTVFEEFTIRVTLPNNITFDKSIDSNIILYPNPVNTVLCIKNNCIIVNIQIISSTGALIQSENSNSTEQQINVHSLPQGTYFVIIKTLDNSVIKQILKE